MSKTHWLKLIAKMYFCLTGLNSAMAAGIGLPLSRYISDVCFISHERFSRFKIISFSYFRKYYDRTGFGFGQGCQVSWVKKQHNRKKARKYQKIHIQDTHTGSAALWKDNIYIWRITLTQLINASKIFLLRSSLRQQN